MFRALRARERIGVWEFNENRNGFLSPAPREPSAAFAGAGETKNLMGLNQKERPNEAKKIFSFSLDRLRFIGFFMCHFDFYDLIFDIPLLYPTLRLWL